MENIIWSPGASCTRCGFFFIAKHFLAFGISSDQLINGPYPDVNISGCGTNCPKCNSAAKIQEYTPEQVRLELQFMREGLLDIHEVELNLLLKSLQISTPENYEALYQLVSKVSPSLLESIQKFKGILNWICLIGGTWAFFKELERTLQ